MKTLHEGLQAHLATGATTLCWCWRLERRDGVIQGFTDHDRNLSFDGVNYEAEAGMTASEIKDAVGLSVGNLEVTGAVSSERLNEGDLAAGLYDDAKVEIYRVNWQDVTQRVLMHAGSLGEVTRAGGAFAAEVRGLAHYLQQPQGRLFQFTCDADLGDARCSVDLDQPAFRGAGTIVTVADNRQFTASGLGAFGDGWFSRGLLTFTSGAAAGQAIEVKRHRLDGADTVFELWQPARGPLAPGQTFDVTAGCDKHPETCRTKFANVVNFRGFPHMPGREFVLQVARRGGA